MTDRDTVVRLLREAGVDEESIIGSADYSLAVELRNEQDRNPKCVVDLGHKAVMIDGPRGDSLKHALTKAGIAFDKLPLATRYAIKKAFVKRDE